ncbi:hypothetical protein FC961_14570 [Clostridium botulinum]|nr:hypothetical protein [Clostridium botulinum]NFO92480.1 hypothetical protein [Clostridium botulinum]
MRYSSELNMFLKKNIEVSTKEKIEQLKQCTTENLLSLLRNIEEKSYLYEKEVIKGVAGCLFDRGVMCM